jgi:hypothetical protein
MNRVFGIAWAGESAVAKVEVSCDGGRSWNQAELVGLQAPYSWTLWEYLWEVGAAGNYELLARATASDGTVQPREHDPLNGGYMIHHSRPVAVCVESVYQAPARLADADVLLYDMNAYAEANMRFPLDVNLEFEAGGGI